MPKTYKVIQTAIACLGVAIALTMGKELASHQQVPAGIMIRLIVGSLAVIASLLFVERCYSRAIESFHVDGKTTITVIPKRPIWVKIGIVVGCAMWIFILSCISVIGAAVMAYPVYKFARRECSNDQPIEEAPNQQVDSSMRLDS